MNTAPHSMEMSSGTYARAADAWTAFWTDPGQSRCAAGAPEIWQVLTDHWASFSSALAPGARVLDLGCGACAVSRLLVEARLDLHVTGIDAARIAPVMYPRIAVLPRTAMEALPFTERRFDAAVSQFGYEYSRTDETARELARVLAPGAKLSFLVHHAGSAIVAATRARLEAIDGLLGSAPRTAFCSGNVAGFGAQIAALLERHPHDSLVTYLARALPPHLVSPQGRRIATWAAIEDALAPERCVSASLLSCCVAEPQLEEWLDPLRAIGEWMPATVIRESNGDPVAWKVEGVCG